MNKHAIATLKRLGRVMAQWERSARKNIAAMEPPDSLVGYRTLQGKHQAYGQCLGLVRDYLSQERKRSRKEK